MFGSTQFYKKVHVVARRMLPSTGRISDQGLSCHEIHQQVGTEDRLPIGSSLPMNEYNRDAKADRSVCQDISVILKFDSLYKRMPICMALPQVSEANEFCSPE